MKPLILITMLLLSACGTNNLPPVLQSEIVAAQKKDIAQVFPACKFVSQVSFPQRSSIPAGTYSVYKCQIAGQMYDMDGKVDNGGFFTLYTDSNNNPVAWCPYDDTNTCNL